MLFCLVTTKESIKIVTIREKKNKERNCNNKIVNIVTIKEKFMTSFSFHTPPSQKACPLTFLDLKKNEVKVYILCSLFPRTYAAI